VLITCQIVVCTTFVLQLNICSVSVDQVTRLVAFSCAQSDAVRHNAHYDGTFKKPLVKEQKVIAPEIISQKPCGQLAKETTVCLANCWNAGAIWSTHNATWGEGQQLNISTLQTQNKYQYSSTNMRHCFLAVCYGLTACTCLLNIRRCCINNSQYIACILCWLAATRVGVELQPW
jgi:hypothetical protein